MQRAWVLAVMASCYQPSDRPADAFVEPDAPPANFLDFCPTNYTLVGDGKYRLTNEQVTWVKAEAECQLDQAAATAAFIRTHLAVLTSMPEQEAVGALTTNAMWVGYTDRLMEGAWEHVNGESALYPGNGPGTLDVMDAWNNGEPNGFTDESCAILSGSSGRPRLDDRQCDDSPGTEFGFLCECDVTASTF